MRRIFCCSSLVWLTITLGAETTAEDALPVGSSPPPIAMPHFPSRLHAFVWRNWQLVEPQLLGQVVGTSDVNMERIAASMGLPPAGAVNSRMRQRGYITLVRRNWHLLPYDQLLTLVGMTPAELAHALREDDFLFVKLGQLKPKCEPLRYKEPDAQAQRRAAEIKQTVERYFGDRLFQPAEPRFQFVDELSSLVGVGGPPQGADDSLRYVYSYFGIFGDPLRDPQSDPYPEGLLARLAETGVNGVWMHVVLRQLAPGGEEFPEFGAGHERRLENLRKIVERAKRYGIGVYLYINEPRSMPQAFFEQRTEIAGTTEGAFVAMCTSQPAVRKWLSDSLTHVFREVPNLGGVFTITASENFTSCASHARRAGCPRCQHRSDAEIIAEVNATIEEGVHRGNPSARVIAWDWGWAGHGDASETIALLPKKVALMSVSEWSLPIERGGVAGKVGEYSMSSVGPGPRATRHWALAKEAGLETFAKLQFNNTWELSAVPYLPVLDLIAEHCEKLAQVGVDGKMLSWTLGGYPSPNLLVAQQYAIRPDADRETVLMKIATDRYGASAAPHARRAWAEFSEAFREFPYHIGVLYHGPQQLGPANLLYGEPTGYRSTMVGFPYDDLDGWRGPYPSDVLAGQFEKVASGWRKGLKHFENMIAAAPDEKRARADADGNVARAVALHFASVANQVRFVMARDALIEKELSVDQQRELREQIGRLVDDEIGLARELFQITRRDSRIGFEASNHYYYVPLDLVEKVISCEAIAQRFQP